MTAAERTERREVVGPGQIQPGDIIEVSCVVRGSVFVDEGTLYVETAQRPIPLAAIERTSGAEKTWVRITQQPATPAGDGEAGR